MNDVISITPPTSPDADSISRKENTNATNKAEIPIRAGTLGSDVLLKRVPPIKTGMRVLVRGILRVESPRFGIKTARIIPATRVNSGSNISISSVVNIRASPPGYS